MKYFNSTEFLCGCGCGLGLSSMNNKTVEKLDLARSIAKVSFVVNSSIRCKEHNAAVGGRDNSAHLSGNAVDISVKNSRARFKIIDGLLKAGFNRIGVYDTFIHCDTDETKPAHVMWYG